MTPIANTAVAPAPPLAPTPDSRPGKSAQAPGQMAKVAVFAAQEAGLALPKNAQGMAASAIAKGADPASVFAALIVPEPVAEVDQVAVDDPVGDGAMPMDGAPDGAADPANTDADNASEPTMPDTNDSVVALYSDASNVLSGAPMTSAQTALDLLS